METEGATHIPDSEPLPGYGATEWLAKGGVWKWSIN